MPLSASAGGGVISSLEPMQWEDIDFMDIDQVLRIKLTDVDVSEFLRSIDAVNRLKSLNLTHLSGVLGHGLEPLRGSSVLKRLDLSIAEKHQSRDDYACHWRPWNRGFPKPRILEEVVLPILESIVDQEGNSLAHLQFPHTWIQGESEDLQRFVRKYKKLLISLNRPCGLGCGRTCSMAIGAGGTLHGDTCYDCSKTVCSSEECASDAPILCKNCTKAYCGDCAIITRCTMDECTNQYCHGCNTRTMRGDHPSLIRKCGVCFRAYCVKCNPVDDCLHCRRWLCGRGVCEPLLFSERSEELLCERCYDDDLELSSDESKMSEESGY